MIPLNDEQLQELLQTSVEMADLRARVERLHEENKRLCEENARRRAWPLCPLCGNELDEGPDYAEYSCHRCLAKAVNGLNSPLRLVKKEPTT